MQSNIVTSQPVDRRFPGSTEFVSTLARPSDAEALRRSSWTQLYRAGVLQRSLLPKIGGPLGGYRLATAYRPCEALCGDFYDILCQPGRTTLVVADVIPNPPRTSFLAAAEAAGCRTIDGLGMLVNQGRIGIRYWTGVEPDTAVMRAALEAVFG